ncbi:MAG: DUF2971 domain-containing protein [Anaerolineales bacterium]|nr:DUF2971 domain-containing protein [Anaerolineales bacterium]
MTTSSFRRYTSLFILLDILKEKRLTLLDPQNWDDTNDAFYMELYKTKMGVKSLLALCFAEVRETYHIWKVFAGDANGVCIEFNKDLLLGYFKEMKSDYVKYLPLDKLKKKSDFNYDQLPFLKRFAFKDEHEFRFIYEDKDDIISSKSLPIQLDCIQRIIFNPWIPLTIFESVKAVIQEIDGCENIIIDRTSLVDNEDWKKRGKEIADLS